MNKKIVKEILSYAIVIVLALLVKQFVFTLIIVNGDSMYPTLEDNDIMILDKFSYYFSDIERFDIVVVKDKEGYLIKRVIGLPGDIISYIDNELYVNDKKIEEDYSYGETSEFGSVKVKKGEYFLMGDNRVVSLDSRKLGSFSKREILGKTNRVIFPFGRFGSKK